MDKNIILKINLIYVETTSKKSQKKRLLPFERHQKLIIVRATQKKVLEKAYYRLNDNESSSKSTTTKAVGKAYYRSSQRIVQKVVLPF